MKYYVIICISLHIFIHYNCKIPLNINNHFTQKDEPESNFKPTPKVAKKKILNNPTRSTKGKAPETPEDENLLPKR